MCTAAANSEGVRQLNDRERHGVVRSTATNRAKSHWAPKDVHEEVRAAAAPSIVVHPPADGIAGGCAVRHVV